MSEMSKCLKILKSSYDFLSNSRMPQNVFLKYSGALGTTFKSFMKNSKNHDFHHFWRHLRAFGPHRGNPNCLKIEFKSYQQILCDNPRRVSQENDLVWPRSRAMLRQRSQSTLQRWRSDFARRAAQRRRYGRVLCTILFWFVVVCCMHARVLVQSTLP